MAGRTPASQQPPRTAAWFDEVVGHRRTTTTLATTGQPVRTPVRGGFAGSDEHRQDTNDARSTANRSQGAVGESGPGASRRNPLGLELDAEGWPILPYIVDAQGFLRSLPESQRRPAEGE